jgi:glycerol-3-phosphate dehydrogenase
VGHGSSGTVMATRFASCIATMVRLWGREEAPIHRFIMARHAQRRWGGEERRRPTVVVVSYNSKGGRYAVALALAHRKRGLFGYRLF